MNGAGLTLPPASGGISDQTVAFAAELIDRSGQAPVIEAALARDTGLIARLEWICGCWQGLSRRVSVSAVAVSHPHGGTGARFDLIGMGQRFADRSVLLGCRWPTS